MTSEQPTLPQPTVVVRAVSIFSSRMFWLNTCALGVAVLSATEVVAIIPPRFMSLYGAVLAGLNIFLRTVTVRPVALIAPGKVETVRIKQVGPPSVPKITD